jgi:inner membrane protein
MTQTPAAAPAAPKEPRPFLGILSVEKILLIAGIALATLIPSLLVSGLVAEREQRQREVQSEFTRNWGPAQRLLTPTLIVPIQNASSRQYLRIAPTRADMVAKLTPQERRRGIFSAIVYESAVDIGGEFLVPNAARLQDYRGDKSGRPVWDEVFIAFGAEGSLPGFRSDNQIEINGTPTAWRPCLEVIRQDTDCRGATLLLASAPLNGSASATTSVAFKTTVALRGTGSFAVVNIAKNFSASMASDWPTPSFWGEALPDTTNVETGSFDAQWQLSDFGQARIWTSANVADVANWKGPTLGVTLLEATPIYRMINRVGKYALLFVALSFATYLFFEILSHVRIHVLQYGLLGLSLSLFSLLLLSLSEFIGYTAGYVVSALLVLLQSSLYTAAVTKRIAPALIFAAMLGSLFAFLYVLLGLETYSLLAGTLALFVAVSVLMVVTQRVGGLSGQQLSGA